MLRQTMAQVLKVESLLLNHNHGAMSAFPLHEAIEITGFPGIFQDTAVATDKIHAIVALTLPDGYSR